MDIGGSKNAVYVIACHHSSHIIYRCWTMKVLKIPRWLFYDEKYFVTIRALGVSSIINNIFKLISKK